MNLNKVAAITIVYVLITIFISFFNYTLIYSPYSLGPSEEFNVNSYLLTNLISGLVTGVLSGTLLVSVNNQLFRRRSFKFAMLTTLMAYILIFLLVTTASSTAYVLGQEGLKEISYDSIIITLRAVFATRLITAYFIFWGVIILFTLFLLQVNDKFGPGILLKFLAGKYHQPRKEQRIFMFLDMRSSTTIAEKIGDEKYFNLLNDLFSDITDTILNNEGEIYQYVGDEIVISWPLTKRIKNGNFLQCFFEIQNRLINLGPIYEKKYGLIPEFKAGIHYGQVMAGEIGIVKKDIIYSGDVLNTTARIQGSCNNYNVDVLISKETFELIQNPEDYELMPLGNIELRGKERKIDLNTIKTR